MTITDLEAYRASITGGTQSDITVTLNAAERTRLLSLLEPKCLTKQNVINNAQKLNHQTEKAKLRLLADIDELMLLLTICKKMKGEL